MNMQDIKGNWQVIEQGLKQQWTKLTESEIASIKGSKERLIALLCEKYGLTREAAEAEVEAWQGKLAE